jgi:hypothetical protein
VAAKKALAYQAGITDFSRTERKSEVSRKRVVFAKIETYRVKVPSVDCLLLADCGLTLL